MYIKFSCFALMLMACLQGFGQDRSITIQVVGGPSLGWWKLNQLHVPLQVTTPLLNGTGGLLVQYPIGSALSLKTGTLLESKGSRYRLTVEDPLQEDIRYVSESRSRNPHLNIPLLLEWFPGAQNRLFVQAGPYVSYRLTQSADMRITVNGTTKSLPAYIQDAQRWGAGISLGAGLKIPLTEAIHLQSSLMFNQGLMHTAPVQSARGIGSSDLSVNLLTGLGIRL
ncbi:MAG: outer membrane beta-barrel protein [Bacteroidota bacterium]